MRNATGKTGKTVKAAKPATAARTKAKASRPFVAADYLKTEDDRAAYLSALLEDGDARVLTIGIRDLAVAVGGVAGLASKTGLSRETLYRTLSPRGNPRLDTVAKLLPVLGLRLTVQAA